VSWFGVGWHRFGEHGPPAATATDIVNNAVLSEGGKEVFIMFIDRFPTWCWADSLFAAVASSHPYMLPGCGGGGSSSSSSNCAFCFCQYFDMWHYHLPCYRIPCSNCVLDSDGMSARRRYA